MFRPVNRYIQIKIHKLEDDLDDFGIVLPDDYNTKQEKHIVASVLAWAPDVRFCEQLAEDKKIVVDQSMVEEISINNSQITIILDNYVVGLFED